MAKFYGIIGYAETKETAPGVWKDDITELSYFGDVLRISKHNRAGENLNGDLTLNNDISIVADPFAYQNFQKMKYVQWMGAYWEITKVEVQRPRLILTIGGVYNGKKAPAPITS